jgi:DNA gyrase subunit B
MGGPHHCVVAEHEEELDDEHCLPCLIGSAVDKAVAEALAGHATIVEVTLCEDGAVQVSDDGRGIEFAAHALNALSARLEVEIRRDGYQWCQRYEAGLPGALERGQRTTTTGTTVRFWLDPTIFETTVVDSMLTRLQEVAFLSAGLTIRVIDRRPPDYDIDGVSYTSSRVKARTFHCPNGLVDYVKHINRTKTPIHPSVVHFSVESPGLEVEIAMQWNAGFSGSVYTFANGINTHDGGSHEEGFRAALTSVVSKYAKDREFMRSSEPDLAGDTIWEGVAAVVSVKIGEPLFEGLATAKLTNAEVKSFVQLACTGYLTRWLDANRMEANVIAQKAISSSDYRRTPQVSCGGGWRYQEM